MKNLRWILCALVAGAFAVALSKSNGRAAFIQTQRDQIAVYILVNVTPAPITYAPPPTRETRGIAMTMRARARGSQDNVDAPNFAIGDGTLVAQTQAAVRVQASISPNPNATLLYPNNTAIPINGTAGTTVTMPCAYTVTVHTTVTSWTLREGLSNDFSGSTFPGSDLANNTYLQGATPNPSATAFTVYPDMSNTWSVLAVSGGIKTYCVDLSLTIPAAVPGGAYSTNAVYTLYY